MKCLKCGKEGEFYFYANGKMKRPCKACCKDRIARKKEDVLATRRRYSNTPRYRAMVRAYRKRQRENLHSEYLKRLMKCRIDDQGILELKRQQLILKRLIYERQRLSHI